MNKDSSQLLADRIEAVSTEPVDRIETHGAIILLRGKKAWKIKRPVKFSFLDFSTPQARKAALLHELELNRRTAPDIYERIVPIAADGRMLDRNTSQACEWALEMRRFDNSRRLDRVIEAGWGDRTLFERLAERIAHFHQSLAPLPEPLQTKAMLEVLRGNAVDLRASVPKVFASIEVEALIERCDVEFGKQQAMLAARQEWVRHCHGDLHSENIVLIDNEPVLFDCIEFNDAFAKIDVLYDIAFLIMDLCERGHKDFAWTVFQAYLDTVPQDSGIALMPLFLSIRAAIRAKVEAFAENYDKANRYLEYAGEALRPVPPVLIAIGGLSGTGKSTLARLIAPRIGRTPGAVLLRSDVERKRMFDVEPTERLPDQAYGADISGEVFSILNKRAQAILESGHAVIVDGVFARSHERQAIEEIAERKRTPFFGFWLETPLATRLSRIEYRRNDASDADSQVAKRQENYDLGAISWQRIDACDTPDALAARIMTRIENE